MKNKVTKIKEFAMPQPGSIKRIVTLGLLTLAFLVGTYVYFVGKIVFDVVARRTAESSIRVAESGTSSLEMQYFNKLKTLDIAQAEAAGLSESHDTLYATRATATAQAASGISAL